MSDEKIVDYSKIQGALGSIGLSGLIVLGGSILSQGMGLGTRVVMTRYLPVSGYGEVVLGITFLNFLGIVSIIGLGQALSRYLPRTDSKDEQREIVASIFQIGFVLSVFWTTIGYFGADLIAGDIFNQPQIAGVIRIFALSLPLYVLFKLSMSGIQGHKKTAPNILTQNLVLPGVRLGAVVLLVLAGFRTIGVAIGYNLAFAVAGMVGFYFFLQYGGYSLRNLAVPTSIPRYRELLVFSIPLAISGSIGIVTKQADVFILGLFKQSDVVGVYDVAFLLSQLLFFFSPMLSYLFQPIMSEFDSENEYQKMDKLYTIVTRWLIILTFPLFTLLVLFPEVILGTVFGSDYRAGGLALLILSIGYFLARVVGFTGSFLTVIGETKVIMYISAGTAILNVILNLAFIPAFGLIGAAVATAIARAMNNIAESVYIYKATGIHPFERELVLPSSIAILFLGGAGYFVNGASEFSLLAAFGTAILMGVIFLACIIATRSVYSVELNLADSVLNRLGLNLYLRERLSILVRRE